MLISQLPLGVQKCEENQQLQVHFHGILILMSCSNYGRWDLNRALALQLKWAKCSPVLEKDTECSPVWPAITPTSAPKKLQWDATPHEMLLLPKLHIYVLLCCNLSSRSSCQVLCWLAPLIWRKGEAERNLDISPLWMEEERIDLGAWMWRRGVANCNSIFSRSLHVATVGHGMEWPINIIRRPSVLIFEYSLTLFL